MRRQTSASIDGLLTNIILEMEEDKTAPGWLADYMEPQKLLQVLYQLEVIGVEKMDSTGLHETRMWEAYDFVFTRPKARPELSATFLFHPGLWKSLELI